MGQRKFEPRYKKKLGRSFNGRKAIDDMYDAKWEAYRKRFLAINPDCYACGKRAQVVDHLKPHQGEERLFKRTDNHIPLCIVCHNTVTSLFDRKYRAGNPVTEKIQWLNQHRVSGGEWKPRKVKVLSSYES